MFWSLMKGLKVSAFLNARLRDGVIHRVFQFGSCA
jgi:hypothetical protein